MSTANFFRLPTIQLKLRKILRNFYVILGCVRQNLRKILEISSEDNFLRKLAIFGSFLRYDPALGVSGIFKTFALILFGEFSMTFPSMNMDNNRC